MTGDDHAADPQSSEIDGDVGAGAAVGGGRVKADNIAGRDMFNITTRSDAVPIALALTIVAIIAVLTLVILLFPYAEPPPPTVPPPASNLSHGSELPTTSTPILTRGIMIEVLNCPAAIELAARQTGELLETENTRLRMTQDDIILGSDLRIECANRTVTIWLPNLPTHDDFYSILGLTGIQSWAVLAEPNPITIEWDQDILEDDVEQLLMATGDYYNRGGVVNAREHLGRLSDGVKQTPSLCLLSGNIALRYAYRNPVIDEEGYVMQLAENRKSELEQAIEFYTCGADRPIDALLANNLGIAWNEHFQNFTEATPEAIEWSDYHFGEVNFVNIELYNAGGDRTSECPDDYPLACLCRAQATYTYRLVNDQRFDALRQPLEDADDALLGPYAPEAMLVSYYWGLFHWCAEHRFDQARMNIQTALDQLNLQWFGDEVLEAEFNRIWTNIEEQGECMP